MICVTLCVLILPALSFRFVARSRVPATYSSAASLRRRVAAASILARSSPPPQFIFSVRIAINAARSREVRRSQPPFLSLRQRLDRISCRRLGVAVEHAHATLPPAFVHWNWHLQLQARPPEQLRQLLHASTATPQVRALGRPTPTVSPLPQHFPQ